MRFSPLPGRLCLGGSHVDKLAAVLSFGKHNHAVDEGEESVILTHAYILAGVMNGAALALQNVAGLSILATKNLYAKTFAFRFTAVL